jgi:hypothetical protein
MKKIQAAGATCKFSHISVHLVTCTHMPHTLHYIYVCGAVQRVY